MHTGCFDTNLYILPGTLIMIFFKSMIICIVLFMSEYDVLKNCSEYNLYITHENKNIFLRIVVRYNTLANMILFITSNK